MIPRNNILNNISELKSLSGNKTFKYRRNYRYYNATASATLENLRNPAVVGYNYNNRELGEEQDTTANPQLNVIASCIDTLHSKIAQSKVRPFFNTINGTFKDIQAVKQAQQFFDVLYDAQNVNRTISDAFKDACIFDTGVVYIDEEAQTIRRALPFQVYTRPSEANYGKLTRAYYEQRDFPVTLLPEKVVSKFKYKNLEYVDFGIYYDTFNKVKAYTANGSLVFSETYNKDCLPFIFLHYKNPVLGDTSTSVADMLVNIQQEINIIMAKIKDASQLNPALTFFVTEGSTIKATQLNNRIGNVIQYRPSATEGVPVTASSPAFIDSQYLSLLDDLINKAYDIVGISQLSAQSKKPSGLNSGVALTTMEDVESDRFETQLNQVIRAYVDVAKTCIRVFDDDKDILPEISNRVSIKWSDIVKESDNMSIQYSGADSLSKDPSTKLQQLQSLATAGVIPSARISQLMQIPDLEMGYSLSNNAIDAVMEVIKECIEDDNFDVPEYVPFELLKEEIINTQLSLKAAGREKNAKDINKLSKLYEVVEDMAAEWIDEANKDNETETNKNSDGSIPYNQNVLEQEAGMTRVSDVNEGSGRSEAKVPDIAGTQATPPTDRAAWVNENDYNKV